MRAGAVDALTTSVDIFATLADLFGVTLAPAHARPLAVAAAHGRRRPAIRDWALTGVWGREVHLIERPPTRRKYARAPHGANAPLSHGPTAGRPCRCIMCPNFTLPLPDERALLDRMPGSRVPVIHQPFRAGDLLPFWAMGKFSGNHLYQLGDDPWEEQNLAGRGAERNAADALRAALDEVEAPKDQYVRLGLD